MIDPATLSPAGNVANLLEVQNLHVHFPTRAGVVQAVNGASYHLAAGETLGIVGESGCGKSVTALSILGLIGARSGRIVEGAIRFNGCDLLALTKGEMRRVRGNQISMIFQDPMTSLNPVLTIGQQIVEAIKLHQSVSSLEARERAAEMLNVVHISEPRRRLDEYPHQLSGGMRQRAMIAMALACNPKVLIADEPTTALDVTIQSQVLQLIVELQKRLSMSVVLITHDLGVIAETAHRVAVMYAGRVVEEASVWELFKHPLHPYTRGLLNSMPKLARSGAAAGRLAEIPGMVPSLREPILGCSFAPRCGLVTARCRKEVPPMQIRSTGHRVSCWVTGDGGARGDV
ncbi:ABC transporter ATP-binding protein [Bradyrhizobium sp. NP1]|uniref:ABC transporter ATP-binding protein n=1 Tax=Bradyrhizobium sp. NP1 TaxID=3049772 RepID=UPI0025A68BF8|nr:ABC transporter ATP-binding protein [Bradyrhizobium sp. NP1]WJR79220.1 ABC transporter ATP-binding protein [Bradyrhizobium sp. NP1]